MFNTFSILSSIFLLGAGQGVFLSFALLGSKAGNLKANRYLAAVTLVFTVTLIEYFLDYSGMLERLPILRALVWPKDYLYGLLIYLYVRELTLPDNPLATKWLWVSFAPAIIQLFVSWALMLQPGEVIMKVLDTEPQVTTGLKVVSFLLGDVEDVAVFLHIPAYLSFSLCLLSKHRQRIGEQFSYEDNISLNWLRILLWSVVVVYGIYATRQIISKLIVLESSLDIYLGLSIVALIYGMGYIGIKQPTIFARRHIPFLSSEKNETQREAELKPLPESITKPLGNTASREKEQQVAEKYQNSSLNKQLSGQLYQELDKHMSQQRPYLNNTLSLPELADQLGISANHLSQTINQQTDKNFFDYVNSYRVEQAKRLLSDPNTSCKTILDVSEHSGFNSKSAFYAAFKKHVGVTPSQFKKQL